MNTRKVFKPNAELMPVVREQLERGLIVNLPVRGYSMRPFLENENDMVTLRHAEDLKVGDAVLAEVTGGTYVLHRIIAIDSDNITLMGDGNVRGTEHCRRKDVLGVVTHYVYPNKTVAAENLVSRVRLWRWLLPIRRYLLFIYRHIHKANKYRINNQNKMKIKEGFVLRDVCGEHIIVSEGLQNIDFSKLINLNESAACMWQAAMDKDFTVDDLVNALTAEYEVEEAQARTDVENVLKQWKELGLIAE